jgi:hypothetical protein
MHQPGNVSIELMGSGIGIGGYSPNNKDACDGDLL